VRKEGSCQDELKGINQMKREEEIKNRRGEHKRIWGYETIKRNETKQNKTRQDKTKQDKTRQNKTRCKRSQYKARQDITREDKQDK
jgi:hypothetical protein